MSQFIVQVLCLAIKTTYAEMRMMILIGSLAIVMQNMAKGMPKDMSPQPINS